jgi:yeast amino acid transporter
MNAVILVSVLSVGNSSVFATSRTLTALANYKQAPRIFTYIDREGRPLVSIFLVLIFSSLAYVGLSSSYTDVFNWLLSLGGLSALFTWASVCLAHLRFRQAWAYNGRTVEELPFKAALGIWGSWFGL